MGLSSRSRLYREMADVEKKVEITIHDLFGMWGEEVDYRDGEGREYK